MLTIHTGGETITGTGVVVGLVDFTANGGTAGQMLPTSVTSGTFAIAPMTSTKGPMANALVPPQTNSLYVVRTAKAAVGQKLSGLTVIGTEQGHLYGGLMVDHCDNAQLADLRILGIPGGGSSEPKETFGVNIWGGNLVVMSRIEVDGRGLTASGIGINNATNITINDANVHDCPYGMPTFWETVGISTNGLVSRNNHIGVNHEQCSGPIRHNGLQCHVPTISGTMHMTLNNNQADDADVIIHLADWSGGHYGANSPFCFMMGEQYPRGTVNKQVTLPKIYGPDDNLLQWADAGSPTHPASNVAAAKADPRHWAVRFR
jgi:hypothetical protein